MSASAVRRPQSAPTTSLLGWAIGAGGGYLVTLPLIFWLATSAGLTQWPYLVLWVLTIGISGSHYGATYLRVYGDPAERRKYGFFAVWVTLAVTLVLVGGAFSPWLGSAILTTYVTWSPWHFAGQNYGVALLFLRRSGIDVPTDAKRLLHLSFFLSFVLAFLALHGVGSNAIYAPTGTAAVDSVQMLSLGIPAALVGEGLYVVGAAYLICTGLALWQLRACSSLAQLLPVAMLAACQLLWFVLPAVVDITRSGTLGVAFGAAWVSAAHSLQYLWVTRQYDRQQGGERSTLRYLGKATLLGNLAFAVPVAILASTALGGAERAYSVPLVVFAAVNLHHFILDGAVWKLRDGRVAKLLIRRDADDHLARVGGGLGWLGRTVWAAAIFFLIVECTSLATVEAEQFGAHRFAGRLIDALGWVGKDDGIARIAVGRRYLEEGDFAEANRHFQESLRRLPSVTAYVGAGLSLERSDRLAEAEAMYTAALTLDPEDANALMRAGLLQLRLDQPGRAMALLERSVELDATNARARRGLEAARRALRADDAESA